METIDYEKLLEKLRAKEIEQIEVEPADFMNFQTALMKFSSRKKVVGTAHLNGKIIYHFDFGS